MQSIVKQVWLYPLICLVLGGITGCASLPDAQQTGAAADTAPEPVPSTPEGQLLNALAGAAAGVEILLPEGVRATADQSYAAASGRTCRQTRLSYHDGRVVQRLACEIDGRWQWVPAVTLTLGD